MSPILSVLISLLAFYIGGIIFRRTKFLLFNPLLLGIIFVILILYFSGISVEEYMKGGSVITFFLAPSTVCLALPLYLQIENLKKYFFPILIGIFLGTIVAITSVVVISKLLNIPPELISSLIPKSITTAIGIEVTKSFGGNVSLTVAAIVATGITGAAIGPLVCKMFKITNPIAVGIALGTSAHAVGTSKAIELGEVEGAMSGLSIGIAGIFTVLLAPLFMSLL